MIRRRASVSSSTFAVNCLPQNDNKLLATVSAPAVASDCCGDKPSKFICICCFGSSSKLSVKQSATQESKIAEAKRKKLKEATKSILQPKHSSTKAFKSKQPKFKKQVAKLMSTKIGKQRRQAKLSRLKVAKFAPHFKLSNVECTVANEEGCQAQIQAQNALKMRSSNTNTKLALRCVLIASLAALAPLAFTLSAANSLQHQHQQRLQVFAGNESSPETNHFKVVEQDADFLLVGARNVLYNISLADLKEQRRIEWPSSDDDSRLCKMKGKSGEQCQNYVRIIKRMSQDSLQVCGTNAYKPKCRHYEILSESQVHRRLQLPTPIITTQATFGYDLLSESSGEGICPYQESQNITATVADGELYTATAATFSGVDALIHKPPLRTEQFNPKQLNSPNFVASFQYGQHVYFLFRETALEFMNCGKTVYSRIARVCANDSGGASRASRERWTSFAKARLNCSLPGEFPFYFDEIQSATNVVSSSLGADLLYAVFTTAPNSIGGSAVCAFKMSEIVAAFDDGPFKAQLDSNSNWLPVQESRMPLGSPRPGVCVADSRKLPDEHINFIKDNPLMDVAVQAVWSQPLVMMASISFRFTQIVVDPQVQIKGAHGAGAMRTDAVFVGTDDGRVFKLVNTHGLGAPPAQGGGGRHSPQRIQSNIGGNLNAASNVAGANGANGANGASGAGGASGAVEPPFAVGGFRALQHSFAAAQAAQAAAREPLPDVSAETVLVEELHLFDARTPIVALIVRYPPQQPTTSNHDDDNNNSNNNDDDDNNSLNDEPKLVAVSRGHIKAVPLQRCLRARTCAECVALRDPYCGWQPTRHKCAPLGTSALLLPPGAARANNLTVPALAWWHSCPDTHLEHSFVAHNKAPFTHVPSRFDFGTSITGGGGASPSQLSPSSSHPLSAAAALAQAPHQRHSPECLAVCASLDAPAAQLVASCGELLAGKTSATNGPTATAGPQTAGYSPESLYVAVIVCAACGLIAGLTFGFALGRSSKKHDSSVCSSAFDDANLYMASTGSHQLGTGGLVGASSGAALANGLTFAAPSAARSTNPLLLNNGGNSTRPLGHHQNHNHNQQLFDAPATQRLLQHDTALHQQLRADANHIYASAGSSPVPPQLLPLIVDNRHNGSSSGSSSAKTQLAGSCASSTNTTSTSATATANDSQQLYLNQQSQNSGGHQPVVSQLNQLNQLSQFQRSFATGQSNHSSARSSQTTSASQKEENQKLQSKLLAMQQQQQQLQQQQQHQQIYL